MNTQIQANFLESLRSELIDIRNSTGLYNKLMDLIQQEHLKLVPLVSELWEILMLWNPGISFRVPLTPILVNKTMKLVKWNEEFSSGFLQELISRGQNISSEVKTGFQISNQDKIIKIWKNPENYYWASIYSLIARWQELVQANLSSVKWGVNKKIINLDLIWLRPFVSIQPLMLTTFNQPLWTMVSTKKLSKQIIRTSNSILLKIQVEALNGGNKIILLLENQRIVMRLQIPRVDVVEFASPSSLVTNKLVSEVINHIFKEIGGDYVKTSIELEKRISQEIERLTPFFEKGDIDDEDAFIWFNKVKEVPDQLAVKRQFFSNVLAEIEES